jgi:Histidine kinase-like ATPase domain
MSGSAWAHRPRPAPRPDTDDVWGCEPYSVADVTAQRRCLAAALHNGSRPDRADDSDVERLLLVFEELVSNGLRHGQGPVRVTVTGTGSGWLLDVSDAAADRPPAPAIGRDAAHGGLGLYLVAGLSAAHGWELHGDRKHVWAEITLASERAAPSVGESVPPPRSDTSDRNRPRGRIAAD